jgi:hypothetical protein
VGPLIYWWVFRPELIQQSQLASLDQLCALSPGVLQRMRAEIPSGALASRCDVFHRGERCAQFHARYLSESMRFAARLYVPIYALSVLAPKYKQWLRGPRPPLTPLAKQYLRTCLCLTLLYQVPLSVSCASPSANHGATVMLAGALTTLALVAEHEKRRASVMKAIGAYTACAAGARLHELLGASPSTATAAQFVLFSAALATLFDSDAPPSSRVMRWLYGRDVEADAGGRASGTRAHAAEDL